MSSQLRLSPQSFLLATIVIIILVTSITIGAELYKPLKDWLAITFGHHWVGKGVIALISFLVVSLGFNSYFRKRESNTFRWAIALTAIITLSVLALIGFFVLEYYHLI
ncbi:MAG: hypothetical protein H3Z53_10965 [archaeon]|nr:hypothetical protein [archaeon]MCP8314872.1 hypothetical protein [archaeon]MCP8316718.1 hypothetical protein [archaeon]MCP8320688.1 hypothetical protein [archaeon]